MAISASRNASNIAKELKATLKQIDEEKDDSALSELTVKTLLEFILDEVKKLSGTDEDMLKAVGEMLIESASLHAETRKAFNSTMGEHIADATDKVLFQRGAAMLSAVFQFPKLDDCRWRLVVIKWRFDSRTARIFKTPLYNYDGNILGEVAQGGQVVKIIDHTLLPGWASIMETTGDDPLRGYIDLNFVTIENLPSRESKHVQQD